MRYSQKTIFNMAAVRHIGFAVTSSLLHPDTRYYNPNTVLNFHLHWFSTFWHTWSFMFHHFGWKLPIHGQIFRVLGVNRGQISISHYITPNRHTLARFRVFWAIARQNPSRFSSLRWSEKKNSHTKKLYFTPLPRSPPWTDFHQIWNIHSTRRHNQSSQILCQSVQGFRFYRGSKFPLFP